MGIAILAFVVAGIGTMIAELVRVLGRRRHAPIAGVAGVIIAKMGYGADAHH